MVRQTNIPTEAFFFRKINKKLYLKVYTQNLASSNSNFCTIAVLPLTHGCFKEFHIQAQYFFASRKEEDWNRACEHYANMLERDLVAL